MNMPLFRGKSGAVYVSDLAKFAHEAEAGRYPEDWLGYGKLPWPRHKLPLLERSKV